MGISNAQILVVDDDAVVRELLVALVTMAGLKVASAGSAEEALQALKGFKADIVIADVSLPGMSGLDLILPVKNEYRADVIIITGNVEEHTYAEAIRKGASDFILKPVRPEELMLRLRRVMEDRETRKAYSRKLQELQELAITDNLTGLYNSRHFFEQLQVEISRAHRYRRALALILLDLDGFKRVNDTHGHIEGDRVLARFGQIVRSVLRESDSAYRYGGDEFIILLPEAGVNQGVIVGERIRAALELERFPTQSGKDILLTGSVGVTEYKSGEKVSALIGRADEAMYASKRQGHNRVTPLVA